MPPSLPTLLGEVEGIKGTPLFSHNLYILQNKQVYSHTNYYLSKTIKIYQIDSKHAFSQQTALLFSIGEVTEKK